MLSMSSSRRYWALFLLGCVTVASPALADDAAVSPASSSSVAAAVRPRMSEADLERQLAQLTSDRVEARRSAARELEALGPEALPAIVAHLEAARKVNTADVADAIKQARSASLRPSATLADALLESKGVGEGYRAAIVTATLLRTLAHIGTTPAVRPLVRVASDHSGALRSDVAHHVQRLGDKAVPALIETRKEASSELRRWGYTQLESMGKRIAGDAVQTKDSQVLADVLYAFANVHDVDALPVILAFVNSDRVQVRDSARDAIGQFGQDALWKLREAYSNVTGRTAPDDWKAPRVAKELFAAYDHLRLQEVYTLLDEGLANAKEGNLEQAVTAFDKVLARQPTLDRRGEMVATYVAYAESLEDEDRPRALSLLRKAARLWPESPRLPHIEAEIAYLEGKELLARGIVDAESFERALQHEPNHEKARAELSRLAAKVEERQERIRTFAAVATTVVVALCGLILFGGRRSPRRSARA